jgi:hypothetical protein
MSKNVRQIKDEHFDPIVRESVRPLIESLAGHAVEDLQTHLMNGGKKLSDSDYHKLKGLLVKSANATLTLSVDVTDKKLLEDWDIYPVSLSQTTLQFAGVQSFNVLPTREDAEREEMMEKRRKAAADQAGGE